MTKKAVSKEEVVLIDKLVHGGQGIGVLDDGRKVFVWDALPGEKILARITKSKKDYAEAITEEIVEPSSNRTEPRDSHHLSTSPWQIMTYDYENLAKKQILEEIIDREKLEYKKPVDFKAPKNPWFYRNKMEYSFYGDDNGLHLALYNRGTHQKQIISGSSIAKPQIDKVANQVCEILDKNNIRAGELKSLILRSDNNGEIVCALFTKNPKFIEIKELKNVCKGLAIVYSNPKSPASVRTKDLYVYGDITLTDQFFGHNITYDVFSFFQVNLGIFNQALSLIIDEVGDGPALDFYSGVGTIGLCLKNPKYLIEIDDANIFYAKQNSKNQQNLEVIQASSEKALDYINDQDILVVDPPRAGLHKDLVNKIIEIKPPKLVYLSCNPGTQARDLKILEQSYQIIKITGYNFFPRTPHIESLAVLVRK